MREEKLKIVSFEQAQKLKEMGFDWMSRFAPSIYYNESGKLSDSPFYPLEEYYPAPTIALAIKWFRDVKKYECEIYFIRNLSGRDYRQYNIFSHTDKVWLVKDSKHFDTYEEAESALLDELLKVEL
ncbi:MAG: hypothetical protein LBT24_01530 [Tannerella sp.]|jgi:hypothetical protein|nr:hypothetical protein [Tannerella sp.]